MHPFKGRMNTLNVYIIELKPGQNKVEEFDGSLLKTNPPMMVIFYFLEIYTVLI